ncbi:H-NS family nucleoid-associated regulatory protein [Aquincola tertiaricarbonis]|uniref:H-NS family nucleoid-associated regulatory protein n=1 Tax=Aquincola tertiaricarbonis TaxID=391953 RepID=UPI002872EECD|nr:H-NS family nucleoid-associated regulatory protein [Aquincola tertiaricarbonis]
MGFSPALLDFLAATVFSALTVLVVEGFLGRNHEVADSGDFEVTVRHGDSEQTPRLYALAGRFALIISRRCSSTNRGFQFVNDTDPIKQYGVTAYFNFSDSVRPPMAKKSLADLQAQIEKLQAEANQLREEEKAGVVARIREAIAAYELTERDLFGTTSRAAAPKRGRQPKARSVAYADDSGNVWGGRGPRPRWLREALQQGKSLHDFATGGGGAGAAGHNASAPAASDASGEAGATAARRGRPPASKKVRAANGKGAAGKPPVKYRDESGNTWSGRGLQPRWLKQALANGSALESFRVEG